MISSRPQVLLSTFSTDGLRPMPETAEPLPTWMPALGRDGCDVMTTTSFADALDDDDGREMDERGTYTYGARTKYEGCQKLSRTVRYAFQYGAMPGALNPDALPGGRRPPSSAIVMTLFSPASPRHCIISPGRQASSSLGLPPAQPGPDAALLVGPSWSDQGSDQGVPCRSLGPTKGSSDPPWSDPPGRARQRLPFVAGVAGCTDEMTARFLFVRNRNPPSHLAFSWKVRHISHLLFFEDCKNEGLCIFIAFCPSRCSRECPSGSVPEAREERHRALLGVRPEERCCWRKARLQRPRGMPGVLCDEACR